MVSMLETLVRKVKDRYYKSHPSTARARELEKRLNHGFNTPAKTVAEAVHFIYGQHMYRQDLPDTDRLTGIILKSRDGKLNSTKYLLDRISKEYLENKSYADFAGINDAGAASALYGTLRLYFLRVAGSGMLAAVGELSEVQSTKIAEVVKIVRDMPARLSPAEVSEMSRQRLYEETQEGKNQFQKLRRVVEYLVENYSGE
ncbi:MAG: hypothetical protein V1729_05510 [Candidatus Woesearchaeota archaeon]